MEGRLRPDTGRLSADVPTLAQPIEAAARNATIPTQSPPIARNSPGEKLLLRIEEAAERLSISRSKTYELISTGGLPVVRLGRSVRIPTEALRQWIRTRTE